MSSPTDRLSQELVQLLAERGDLRQLVRGETLIEEGDSSDAMYILLSGELKVFTRDERGRELIYNMLGPGEVLGEMFLDGGPRSASVRATTNAQCLEVREDEIRDFIRLYPELSESLLVKLIHRLRRATSQIRSLALDGVYVRTVALINELTVLSDGAPYLPPSVTQQDIASRIGATREMVNHVFRDLVRGGFLVRDDDRGLRISKPLPKRW